MDKSSNRPGVLLGLLGPPILFPFDLMLHQATLVGKLTCDAKLCATKGVAAIQLFSQIILANDTRTSV